MSHKETLEDAFEISAVRATETVKDKVEHLKEKLAMVQSDLDEALKVNSKLNINLQEDMATRLSETLRKNNDDLTLECKNMKKVIEEFVTQALKKRLT